MGIGVLTTEICFSNIIWIYVLCERVLVSECRLNKLILMNCYVMETRAMSPPATFDGLFLKDDIIPFIYDLLMTR